MCVLVSETESLNTVCIGGQRINWVVCIYQTAPFTIAEHVLYCTIILYCRVEVERKHPSITAHTINLIHWEEGWTTPTLGSGIFSGLQSLVLYHRHECQNYHMMVHTTGQAVPHPRIAYLQAFWPSPMFNDFWLWLGPQPQYTKSIIAIIAFALATFTAISALPMTICVPTWIVQT